jgi:hypothetical protein
MGTRRTNQREVSEVGWKGLPQWLKPGSFIRFCGTSKLVPFQNDSKLTQDFVEIDFEASCYSRVLEDFRYEY